MTEHPIIFKTDMVQAILEGRKTMTRRVVKPQPKHIQILRNGKIEVSQDGGFDNDVRYIKCPYGQVGDGLWVRETWREGDGFYGMGKSIFYKANEEYHKGAGWKPSIHMSRQASRITLEITNIGVERVQEIRDKEEDAIKEGFIPQLPNTKYFHRSARAEFISYWDSLNTKRGYSWQSNPYVWVIEVKIL